MPKKIITLFILSIASLAILVHGVMPHHHHQGLACLDTDHSKSTHSHDADCSLSIGIQVETEHANHCALNEGLLRRLHQDRTDKNHAGFGRYLPSDFGNATGILYPQKPIDDYTCYYYSLFPVFHSADFTTPAAFRAPPLV